MCVSCSFSCHSAKPYPMWIRTHTHVTLNLPSLPIFPFFHALASLYSDIPALPPGTPHNTILNTVFQRIRKNSDNHLTSFARNEGFDNAQSVSQSWRGWSTTRRSINDEWPSCRSS